MKEILNRFSDALEDQGSPAFLIRNGPHIKQEFSIGLVRNPCDYYVSMFAFWVSNARRWINGQGYGTHDKPVWTKCGLYAGPHLRPNASAAYIGESAEDKTFFRHFLRRIISPKEYDTKRFNKTYGDVSDLPKEETLDAIDALDSVGLETLRLYALMNWDVLMRTVHDSYYKGCFNPSPTQVKEINDFFEKRNVHQGADCWVHTETLVEDTFTCLDKLADIISKTSKNATHDAHIRKAIKGLREQQGKKHKNKSPRGSCEEMFDEKSKALVMKRDRHIFKTFGYPTCCGKVASGFTTDVLR